MKKIVSYVLVVLFIIAPIERTTAKSFETQQWQTKNGVRVIFYQAMEVHMLDISMAFAAGSAYDGEKYGLSFLTTQLLNQGSKGLDTDIIAKELAQTGAQYEAASSHDMVILNLRTLTSRDTLKKASEIFADILSHPDFSEGAFNRVKSQQLMAIAQALESPDEIANQSFYQMLYQKHPYGHPVLGQKEPLNHLSREDVRTFYSQYFVGHNAILVIVGAINQQTAHQLAERLSRDLSPGHIAEEIPTAHALKEEMDIIVPFPSSQTVLYLGQLGITHHDPDYFPLMVGNYILGGGSLVSRLSQAVREKRGWTYGIYSQFSPMPGKGPFMISFSTKTSHAKDALKVTQDLLSTFINEGPTPQELNAAKAYLSGSFPLSLASNRSIANMLIKIAFYHLPDDFLTSYIEHINAVSIDDIKTSFKKHLTPSKLIQVSVGKTDS